MRPSVGEIKKIDDALIGSLDGEWTDREFILYRTLVDRLKKYECTAKNYAVERRDRENILLNIRDRLWFQRSGHKSHINNFIESMRIKRGDSKPLNLHLCFKHPITGKKVDFHASESAVFLKYGDSTDHLVTIDDKIEGVPQNTIFGPKAFLPMDVIHIIYEVLHYYDTECKIVDYPMSPGSSVTIRVLSEGWGTKTKN